MLSIAVHVSGLKHETNTKFMTSESGFLMSLLGLSHYQVSVQHNVYTKKCGPILE